jgi:hypothetical protein
VVFSPDFSTFSVLYQGMETGTAGLDPALRRRLEEDELRQMALMATPRRCKIQIAFRVAPGKQLELQQIDYRAYVNAPSDRTFAVIESKHLFIGGSIVMGRGRNPSDWHLNGVTMLKQGPFDDDLVWSARFSPTATTPNLGLHVSNCSGTADFGMDTIVRSHTFDPAVDVFVALDSADATMSEQSAVYRIAEKNCDETNRRRDRVCRNGRC